MDDQKNIRILYINTYGQTKFTVQKQLQIEELIKLYNCDIVHLQETHFDDETFKHCPFIRNNYLVIPNNRLSKYGTASLIRNDLNVENVCFDANGRIIF